MLGGLGFLIFVLGFFGFFFATNNKKVISREES